MSSDFKVPMQASELVPGHVVDLEDYGSNPCVVLVNSRRRNNSDYRNLRLRDARGVVHVVVADGQWYEVYHGGYPRCLHQGRRGVLCPICGTES